MADRRLTRRHVLLGTAGVMAAGAVGLQSTTAGAAQNGHGLTIRNHEVISSRLHYFRFSTDAISWDPAVNVLLPDGYDSGRRYPVIYLLHGGGDPTGANPVDFRWWHQHGNVVPNTAGKDVIVVMPDGGVAGWYCNPVHTATGPKDWETFHMAQLLPWVDANFRTFAEYDGRAVMGYSMGGFGALKYAAKYYGHFCAVTSVSGPASIRRDFGAVAQWMQTSATVDLGVPGGIYGIPWDEKRVSADNAVENIERYRHKRVSLYAGTRPDVQEPQVLAGHREFGAKLHNAGIPFDQIEQDRGHGMAGGIWSREIPGLLGRLRNAG